MCQRRWLLGIAVDPAFQSGSPFIYLYYTHREEAGCDAASRANRVSRFTIDGSGAIGGETVLIDNIAAPGGNHNGGDLQFDRNGPLCLCRRWGLNPETARSLASLNGKILRIDRHGGIPGGNPFTVRGPSRAGLREIGDRSDLSGRSMPPACAIRFDRHRPGWKWTVLHQ